MGAVLRRQRRKSKGDKLYNFKAMCCPLNKNKSKVNIRKREFKTHQIIKRAYPQEPILSPLCLIYFPL